MFRNRNNFLDSLVNFINLRIYIRGQIGRWLAIIATPFAVLFLAKKSSDLLTIIVLCVIGLIVMASQFFMFIL